MTARLQISDDDIQKALDYLRDNADEAAMAEANVIYLTEYRKTLKARLMGESNEKTHAAREEYAYAHTDYEKHIDAIREAVRVMKKHRFLRAAADAKFEAWRTQSSNYRAMKI